MLKSIFKLERLQSRKQMVDIRKISVGADYKNNAMHYLIGQPVLDKTYNICHISSSKMTLLVYTLRKTMSSIYGRASIQTCQYQSSTT